MVARARRHPISGDRLRKAGDAAAKLAMQIVSGQLNMKTRYAEEMVACTYDGPTSEEDEQLNWNTPVKFTWKFHDVAGEFAMSVQAGRALGKRMLPIPRALRPPLVAACLPHLLTATRVLPCMRHHDRSLCRAVALPQVGKTTLNKASFSIGGKSYDFILCACVSGRQWLVHPVGQPLALKNLEKMNVPETARFTPYEGSAADRVVAAAIFAAEKERARDQHRPMDMKLAEAGLDTSPFSWAKSTKEFFVLWTSWDGDGMEADEHLTLARLPHLRKLFRTI